VAFEIDGTVIDLLYCHCSLCRKAHGSAPSAWQGESLGVSLGQRREADSVLPIIARSTRRVLFCLRLEPAHQVRRKASHPGLALGVLDDDPMNRPICHVFVGSKAPWHEITDALPQFEHDPTGPVAPNDAA
jgi:hypothetical protein